MTEVIILRHAETEAEDVLKGSLDTEITRLSKYGIVSTMVTARAIRDYYRDVPIFYFAHGHYKRASETAGIVEKVIVTKEQGSSDYSPQDLIYSQQLLGAKPLKLKNLRERGFGLLEGRKLSELTSLVQNNTSYPNLMEFLLYGTSEDFEALAKLMKVEGTKKGEDYKGVFERAYRVSNKLLEIIATIDNPREKSVILLTTHRIFGIYLVNALINSVSAKHFPETFQNDRKYDRHLLYDYDIGQCRFARLEITFRDTKEMGRKPHCIIREINDGGHLVCIQNMSVEERDKLIEEAKHILKGSSK